MYRIVCLFHAVLDLFMGVFMILNINTLSRLAHDVDYYLYFVFKILFERLHFNPYSSSNMVNIC